MHKVGALSLQHFSRSLSILRFHQVFPHHINPTSTGRQREANMDNRAQAQEVLEAAKGLISRGDVDYIVGRLVSSPRRLSPEQKLTSTLQAGSLRQATLLALGKGRGVHRRHARDAGGTSPSQGED